MKNFIASFSLDLRLIFVYFLGIFYALSVRPKIPQRCSVLHYVLWYYRAICKTVQAMCIY